MRYGNIGYEIEAERSQARMGGLIGKSHMSWKPEHATVVYEVEGDRWKGFVWGT